MKLVVDEAREIKHPTSRDLEEALRIFHSSIRLNLENTHDGYIRVTKSNEPDTLSLDMFNIYDRRSSSTYEMSTKMATRYLKACLSAQMSPRNIIKFMLIVFGLLLVFFTINTFFDPVSQKVSPTTGDKLGAIGQVMLPLAGFAGYIGWVTVAMSKIRPLIAKRLGEKLGVTIVQGRKLHWGIEEKDFGRGCLVSILDLGISMALFFGPMVVLLLLLIFARGGF